MKVDNATKPITGLTIIEFAQANDRDRTWFYGLVRTGHAPEHIKVDGKTIIPHAAIEKWKKTYTLPSETGRRRRWNDSRAALRAKTAEQAASKSRRQAKPTAVRAKTTSPAASA